MTQDAHERAGQPFTDLILALYSDGDMPRQMVETLYAAVGAPDIADLPQRCAHAVDRLGMPSTRMLTFEEIAKALARDASARISREFSEMLRRDPFIDRAERRRRRPSWTAKLSRSVYNALCCVHGRHLFEQDEATIAKAAARLRRSDWRGIPNFGRRSYGELKAWLRTHGYHINA